MKLGDVMGAMGLEIYAEVGLIIFFFVFVAIVVHVTRASNSEGFERARRLPLDDTARPPAAELANTERGAGAR